MRVLLRRRYVTVRRWGSRGEAPFGHLDPLVRDLRGQDLARLGGGSPDGRGDSPGHHRPPRRPLDIVRRGVCRVRAGSLPSWGIREEPDGRSPGRVRTRRPGRSTARMPASQRGGVAIDSFRAVDRDRGRRCPCSLSATGPADAVAVLEATAPAVALWRDRRPPEPVGALAPLTIAVDAAPVSVDVSASGGRRGSRSRSRYCLHQAPTRTGGSSGNSTADTCVGVLAGRPDRRNRLDPPPTRWRTGGHRHLRPGTDAALAALRRPRTPPGRHLLVLRTVRTGPCRSGPANCALLRVPGVPGGIGRGESGADRRSHRSRRSGPS